MAAVAEIERDRLAIYVDTSTRRASRWALLVLAGGAGLMTATRDLDSHVLWFGSTLA